MTHIDMWIMIIYIVGLIIWAFVFGFLKKDVLAAICPVWFVFLPLFIIALIIVGIFRLGEKFRILWDKR